VITPAKANIFNYVIPLFRHCWCYHQQRFFSSILQVITPAKANVFNYVIPLFRPCWCYHQQGSLLPLLVLLPTEIHLVYFAGDNTCKGICFLPMLVLSPTR